MKEDPFPDYESKVMLSFYQHQVCKRVEEFVNNTVVILETGSGFARFSLVVADGLKSNGISCYIVGLDLLENILKNAKKTFAQHGISADFVVADLQHLPFKNESFSFVHSQGVCEHFMGKDRQGVFDEMAHVLKSEGLFFAMVPNRLNVFWSFELVLSSFARLRYGASIFYEYPFTIKELAGRIVQAGLVVTNAGGLNRTYNHIFARRMALTALGKFVHQGRLETLVPREDFTRVDRDYGSGNAWLIMGRHLWAFASKPSSC